MGNCKDLIRRLMQADPAKRIEWKDFFKHPLFDQQGKNKSGADKMEIHQSVMFHNNKGNVNQEFMNNKNQNMDDVELVDPLQIKLDQAPNQNNNVNNANKA